MFIAYTRPRYQVSVYRTIGPLVIIIIIIIIMYINDALLILMALWCM